MINWQVVWNWISDPSTQKTLGFLGAGIVAVLSAAWVIFTYFNNRKKKDEDGLSATRITADRGSIAAGRDVITNSKPSHRRKKSLK